MPAVPDSGVSNGRANLMRHLRHLFAHPGYETTRDSDVAAALALPTCCGGANILKSQDVESAPKRKSIGSWETFLKAHWDVLASVDFTTVEVWTKAGLTTFYLLFVMELKTRRVHFAGCTPNPTEAWMQQAARELTNFEDGFLSGKKLLIMDGDPKFTQAFRGLLRGEGIKLIRLPSRSPNLNAHIERFFGSLKPECLDRLILFSKRSLRNAVCEYLAHYHTERNTKGWTTN